MADETLDARRLEEGFQALSDAPREARPLVMRWAVVTVALQDLVRTKRKVEATWPEVAAIAARWLEDIGRATGKWKTSKEAALQISGMTEGMALPEAPARLGLLGFFDRADRLVSLTMQRYGFRLLRISLGIVFAWFGALKPLHLSPADELVTRTVTWIPPHFFIPFLGVWEMAIGIGLMFRPLLRVALLLLFLQMPGTALPLFVAPDLCFTHFPYGLTLEGQYIIKNLTLVSAAIVVGGTVRHGTARELQERVTWML